MSVGPAPPPIQRLQWRQLISSHTFARAGRWRGTSGHLLRRLCARLLWKRSNAGGRGAGGVAVGNAVEIKQHCEAQIVTAFDNPSGKYGPLRGDEERFDDLAFGYAR